MGWRPFARLRVVRLPKRWTSAERRARPSLLMTASLAAVLCGLGAFTLWGTLQTARATTTQSHALELDALFMEARNAVTVEEMHTRQYQLEPSVASRARYTRSADSADDALRRAGELATGAARGDAERLRAEQAEFRLAADRLIELVTDRSPDSVKQDRLEVAPAYYTLQQDVDAVSRAYHSEAQRLVADLRALQDRILVTTALGFALGLGLVAMIWRVMLGYQRRVLEHAAASQHLALHDALTGLANRTLFERRLHEALTDVPGKSGRLLAVMLIDLNGFKGVNDTLGHQAGDDVLVETGQRLRAVLRDGDVLARIGGDEFAVLLPNIATEDVAQDIAVRATKALRQNYILSAGAAAISGSVGITFGTNGASAENLMRHADAAMYRAKTSGKGTAVYDSAVDTDKTGRMALFGDLRAVLDSGNPDGQLCLFYQPQLRIADCTVPAAEALVRWQHPSLGLLLPGSFLTIAETGGLEIPLTYYLLGQAVAEAARWHASGHSLVISVNISPNCLLDDGFVAQVSAALKVHALPPALLRLELTESSMMTDTDRAVAVLGAVHTLGVQLSIDDFGTGFSSLAQLKRLTADELKIDRTFIEDLATNSGDAILVRSAIDLAHNLNLLVTAEGVDDLAALAMLRDLGCDHVQGFALSPPVPASELLTTCAVIEQIAHGWLAAAPLAGSGDGASATG